MPAPVILVPRSFSPSAHQRLLPARIPIRHRHLSLGVPVSCIQPLDPELRVLAALRARYQQGLITSQKGRLASICLSPQSQHQISGGILPTDPFHDTSPPAYSQQHTVPLFSCGVLTPVLTLCQFSLRLVDTPAVTTWGSRRLIDSLMTKELLHQEQAPPSRETCTKERPPLQRTRCASATRRRS